MTPGQRRFHARLWPVLTLALLVAIVLLTIARPERAPADQSEKGFARTTRSARP